MNNDNTEQKYSYEFTLKITGVGESPEEAFAQALLNLSEEIDEGKIMLRDAKQPGDEDVA